MKLSIIVATDINGAIGKDNQLPWHMPADLAHFKKVTMGKPVIMGRKTFESIGRPLPGRLNVVVSKTLSPDTPGITVVDSLNAALAFLADWAEVFVIGGGQLYREALPLADQLYLTKIHTVVEEADTWFPKVTTSQWKLLEGTTLPADIKNRYAATYMKMEAVELGELVPLGSQIFSKAKIVFPGVSVYAAMQNRGDGYTYTLYRSDDHKPLQMWEGLSKRLVVNAIKRWVAAGLTLGDVLLYR